MMHQHITDTQKPQHRSGEVVRFPGKIEADRKQIVAFVNTIFKRCRGIDGHIALRAFEHAADKPVLLDWAVFGEGLIDKIHAAATRVGNRSGSAAAVFSPPACLFKSTENARVKNIAAGPVISVELDERPTHSATSLEAILGKPTVIVASGGVWTAPDGTKHDKLHLYWRLSVPATTPEQLADLNLARKLATAIVEGDKTNIPVSHPIRWPGSFHTKTDTPRMCQIIGGDPEREISLGDALDLLKVAAGPLAEKRGDIGTGERIGLLGAFGAYKNGAGADRAHFLRSFDGQPITADRVGSGTISAERASLSVLAGTQPDKLREVVKGLGDDGLLQRFLVVLHDGRERKALDEAPDREAAAWYSSAIERLANAGYVFPDPVRLSPEAGAVLAAAIEQIKALKHFPGAPVRLKDHLEKWGALLPRLILIMHVVRQMDEGEGFDPAERIEPETVQMAVRLASFFLDHSIAFYLDYFGASKSASEARWIAGHLLTRPDLTVATKRDIYDHRKTLRGQDGNRVLLAAMRELEEFGWCWVKDRDESGPTSWVIDQRIHDRFADRADRERQERSEKHQKIVEAGKARTRLREGFEAQFLVSEGVFG